MRFDQIRDEFATIESQIEEGPIVPNVTAAEIRTYLNSHFDFKRAMPLDEVVDQVVDMLRNWQVQVTHPRYLGLFNPSVTLASVLGDTLCAIYNPQLANWRTSPAANEIERHTLDWLADRFGFPKGSIATFTSGGSEANLSAIVVALTRSFPGYDDNGLRHLTGEPTIYLTEESHHGFRKLAHMVGLGRRNVRIVSTDSSLRMDTNDLKECVDRDRNNGLLPFMVIGTAGTTATGTIDPLLEIGQFCTDAGLWFHADAAWGGAAIVSPSVKHSLNGIDTADSITCDAHKWLSVPMGCGMFFCRHHDSVAQAFRSDVTYMPSKSEPTSGETFPTFDPLSNSAQWSRRFIGLKLFMALAEHGESGYAEMLNHQVRMGDLFRRSLIETGWRIVNSTPLPVVCFTRDGLISSRLLADLREHQIAWMTEATVAGTPTIRACISSFRTTEKDILGIVDQMNALFFESTRPETAISRC